MSQPKMLSWDIETTPNLVYTYDLFSKSPTPIQWVVEPQRMACFAAGWYGERKVHFHSEWKDGQQGMAEALWALLDEADVLLTYNGLGFDEPWANTVFKQAGLSPPSPSFHIDLYRATKKFRLPSHKLQWVSTKLVDAGGKVSISLMMEIQAAIGGDEKAQRKVERYNKGDVSVLFKLYDELIPWLKLPNRRLYGGPPDACPRCESTDRQKRGFRYTPQSKFQRWFCNACQGWSTDTTRLQGAGGVAV